MICKAEYTGSMSRFRQSHSVTDLRKPQRIGGSSCLCKNRPMGAPFHYDQLCPEYRGAADQGTAGGCQPSRTRLSISSRTCLFRGVVPLVSALLDVSLWSRCTALTLKSSARWTNPGSRTPCRTIDRFPFTAKSGTRDAFRILTSAIGAVEERTVSN